MSLNLMVSFCICFILFWLVSILTFIFSRTSQHLEIPLSGNIPVQDFINTLQLQNLQSYKCLLSITSFRSQSCNKEYNHRCIQVISWQIIVISDHISQTINHVTQINLCIYGTTNSLSKQYSLTQTYWN